MTVASRIKDWAAELFVRAEQPLNRTFPECQLARGPHELVDVHDVLNLPVCHALVQVPQRFGGIVRDDAQPDTLERSRRLHHAHGVFREQWRSEDNEHSGDGRMAERHGLDVAFRRPPQRRDSAYWSGEPGEGTMIRFSIWSRVYAGKPSFFANTCGGQRREPG